MSDLYIDPDREFFAKLRSLPQNHPVEMLNLVSLLGKANYEDGRESTGAEAYAAYGRESASIFKKIGGEIIWTGDPQFMVIGPQEEKWDVAFVARYPSGQAFLDMVFDPDYQAVVHHRQAAVKTSRLLRTKPRGGSNEFG